jgi:hypothetical protein
MRFSDVHLFAIDYHKHVFEENRLTRIKVHSVDFKGFTFPGNVLFSTVFNNCVLHFFFSNFASPPVPRSPPIEGEGGDTHTRPTLLVGQVIRLYRADEILSTFRSEWIHQSAATV